MHALQQELDENLAAVNVLQLRLESAQQTLAKTTEELQNTKESAKALEAAL